MNANRTLPRKALFVAALVMLGAMHLAACEGGPQEKQAIELVKNSLSPDTPICPLEHKHVRISPSIGLGPWSMSATRVPLNKPESNNLRTWDVTFDVWCYGVLGSGDGARLKQDVTAHVAFEGAQESIRSWTVNSSSPLSPLLQLIWILLPAIFIGMLGPALRYGDLIFDELWTVVPQLLLKLPSAISVPLMIVFAAFGIGLVTDRISPLESSLIVVVCLTFYVLFATLRRLRAKHEGIVLYDYDEMVLSSKEWFVVGLICCFLFAGIYAMGAWAGSALGVIVGLLTCGAIGFVCGPLSIGGKRWSAILGGIAGGIAGAVSGAQIAAPEPWILAILGGAIVGKLVDNAMRSSR